jgi:hypothetical protein
MSLPLVGLLGAARTSAEGATKYGRLNYLQGMPLHDILDHVFGHLVMYALGDRSEPHLEHMAWGSMCAVQSSILHPELNAPHLPGPGVTLTPEARAYLDEHKADLAARRKAGEFADIGNWSLRDLPEIRRLLQQRAEVLSAKTPPTLKVFEALPEADVDDEGFLLMPCSPQELKEQLDVLCKSDDNF